MSAKEAQKADKKKAAAKKEAGKCENGFFVNDPDYLRRLMACCKTGCSDCPHGYGQKLAKNAASKQEGSAG